MADKADKAALRQAILEAQAQIQQQTQQALAEKMSSICFKRCIPSPMEKLGDRQQRCLQQCVGAYLEGFGVAVRGFCLSATFFLTSSLFCHDTLSFPHLPRFLAYARRAKRSQALQKSKWAAPAAMNDAPTRGERAPNKRAAQAFKRRNTLCFFLLQVSLCAPRPPLCYARVQ